MQLGAGYSLKVASAGLADQPHSLLPTELQELVHTYTHPSWLLHPHWGVQLEGQTPGLQLTWGVSGAA